MKTIRQPLLVIIICLGSWYVQAQVTFDIPQQLAGKKAECHEYVEGTKVWLCPPNGYIAASNWQGYEHDKTGSSIIVLEMPAPWDEVKNVFTDPEGLKSQGVVVHQTYPVQVDGREGYFVVGEQFAYGAMYAKYILVFNTGNSVVMVNGAHPDELDEFADDLVESMLSVIYNTNQKVDHFAGVTYQVDVSKSKFQFAIMTGSMHLFTVDGNAPPQTDDKAAMMVGNTIGYVKREDHKQVAVDRLQKLPLGNIVTEKIEPITIDGISGFEILAKADEEGNPEPSLVYFVMLYSDEMYYMVIGIAPDDHEQNLQTFKQVAQTFRRK